MGELRGQAAAVHDQVETESEIKKTFQSLKNINHLLIKFR